MELKLPLYMDYQATTPLDPRVLDAMMPYLGDKFGNPHSVSHPFGWEAEARVEKARAQVAALIGAEAREIFFTSGATESNNIAIKGVARRHRERKNHVVTVVTEHKCVLGSARALESEGFSVTYLPVGGDGLIDVDALDDAITARTALVSVMAVNNEIGVIQPLEEIGAICRRRGTLLHTDAAQAVGKIALDVEALAVDLMSVSGHKIYGPKGIGALYIRRRPRVALTPLFSGGGQERGIRPGTLSPALCAGLGAACEIAAREMAAEQDRLGALFRKFLDGVRAGLDGVRLNGDERARFPGNINLSFAGVDGDVLMAEMRDLAVASGAACASATAEPSYVLRAIGLEAPDIASAIRFGIGRFTTEAEIEFAVKTVVDNVSRARRLGVRSLDAG